MYAPAHHPGRPRPACSDLPPTLRPLAVLSAAPKPDRRTSALAALAVYLVAGAGVMALGRTVRAVVKDIRTHGNPVVVEFERPAPPTATQRRPAVATTDPPAIPRPAPPDSDLVPERPPARLSTEDHAKDGTRLATPDELRNGRPENGGVTGLPVPRSGGEVGGSVVHDVSSQPPRVLRAVNPLYPDPARRARVQGPVELLITIDPSGAPSDVQVLSGHPAFHAEAERAARQWRFEPARVDGAAVQARFRLTIAFRLA